jgi:hypothetical protein
MRNLGNVERQIKAVEDMKLLVPQLTRIEYDEIQSRFKRGTFNFIGGVRKILFGIMDSEDTSYCTDKIQSLGREGADFLKLSKEQISVGKWTLRSINATLQNVPDNERGISKGL